MRLSEDVADPLTATALALDSGEDHVIFVSCDVVVIPDEWRDAIRALLKDKDFDPQKVLFNATHTHTGPEIRVRTTKSDLSKPDGSGVFLNAASIQEYLEDAARQVAQIVIDAWHSRKPGSIAYGQDFAVIGRNRRWVDHDGKATMYGLNKSTFERFSHIEGYEDHSVNLLATYDDNEALTGLLINLPCPSQDREMEFVFSADFWNEARQLLREKWGKDLFILPQCSAAGDQAPRPPYEKQAYERMLQLRGRTSREETAHLIQECVARLLPDIAKDKQSSLLLRHQVETLELDAIPIQQHHVEEALREAAHWRNVYEEEKQKLEDQPESKNQPHWYVPVTRAFRRMNWYQNVQTRFEQQSLSPKVPAEIHVVRLGEIAFASVPFEYYLDFGIRIKVRSPALQTFLIQLSGGGTYVPSERSVKGGGYGSIPASNPVGPEGGQIMADYIVKVLYTLFE